MHLGQRLYTDPNEDRICKVCKKEKKVTEFVRGKVTEACVLYRYTCKECDSARRRTGKPNTGRFQPGHSRGKRYQKGNVSWSKENKGKYGHSYKRNRFFYKQWSLAVKERDGYKCSHCNSTEKLHAHHIVAWKDCEEKRFDVNNGKTLCNSCHAKEEGLGIKIRP